MDTPAPSGPPAHQRGRRNPATRSGRLERAPPGGPDAGALHGQTGTAASEPRGCGLGALRRARGSGRACRGVAAEVGRQPGTASIDAARTRLQPRPAGRSERRRGHTRLTHAPGAHRARHTNIFYETALTCRNAQESTRIPTILPWFSFYLRDRRSESPEKTPRQHHHRQTTSNLDTGILT